MPARRFIDGKSFFQYVSERAIELHAQGESAAHVLAYELGVKPSYVRTVMHRARQAGWHVPHSHHHVSPAMEQALSDLRQFNMHRGTAISQAEYDRDGWREHANCKGIDPNLFHPERGSNGFDMATAKNVCAGCTVRQDCLDYALDNFEMIGIWGGTTERERRRIRSRRYHEQKIVEVRTA